jgi:hypothetical protein
VFVSGVAHSWQNFAPGFAGVPQLGHATASGVAHSWQNFAPTLFCVPQLGQINPSPALTGSLGEA